MVTAADGTITAVDGMVTAADGMVTVRPLVRLDELDELDVYIYHEVDGQDRQNMQYITAPTGYEPGSRVTTILTNQNRV
jgi:hypothetical protein